MTDDKWLLEPANAKPMTPRLFGKYCIGECDHLVHGACLDCIEKVIQIACTEMLEQNEILVKVRIDAACAEARAEGYTQGCADTIHNSPMYEAGFSDCREQAAKLMEPKKILRENGKEVQVGLGLASEIRALTPGEGTKACRCACHSIPERYAHLDGKCLGCHKPGEVAK